MSDSPYKISDGSEAKPGRVVYTVDQTAGIITARTVQARFMYLGSPAILADDTTFYCSDCFPSRVAARDRSRSNAEWGLGHYTARLELCRKALAELPQDAPADLPAPLPPADAPAGPADEFGERFEMGEPVA